MSVVRIASKAGVSIATVSRVLNNSRRVNPRLVDQVQRAMTELNFTASQVRRKSTNDRAGVKSPTKTIAIVSVGAPQRGWFEMPVIATVVAEIARAAEEAHIGTLITEMPDPDRPIAALRRQSIDGALLFVSSEVPAEACNSISATMPVVRVMGGQGGPSAIDHVTTDNLAVGHLAADRLAGAGCRELVFLSTHAKWSFVSLRAHGFLSRAAALGAHARLFVESRSADVSPFVVEATRADGMTELVARFAQHLRNRPASAGPVGVFVPRDEEVVEFYAALARQGIAVDDRLCIVSCDNERVRLASLVWPPESIDINPAGVARHAVARLVERIGNVTLPPARILVQPRFDDSPEAVHELRSR